MNGLLAFLRGLPGNPRAVDTLFTVLLVVFSVYYLWQAFLLPAPPNAPLGPGSVPILIGVLMGAAALRLLYLNIRPAKMAAEIPALDEEIVPGEDDDTSISDWWAVALVLGSLLAVVLLFEPLGFVLVMSVFIFGLATFFERKRWLTNLIVALLVSVFFYELFTRVLEIPLPPGPLRSLL